MPGDSAEIEARTEGNLVTLALLGVLAGLGAGIVCGLFRLTLEWAAGARDALITRAWVSPVGGFLLIVLGAAAATGLAAWLVRRYSPAATGSGIPHVEAVLEGALPLAPLTLLPVKFVGGVLAIGAGLALGREGPSVQMAASVAQLVGRTFRHGWADVRSLIAAGAGAGLATAFNAPMAGAVFVLEELVGRFEPRMAVLALGASASAISVTRLIAGDAPDFIPPPLPPVTLSLTALSFGLGLVSGLLAVGYNRGTIAALDLADRIGGPVELRAATIGAAIGALAFFAPDLVGGGDALTQQAIDGVVTGTLALLPLIFLLRFALGAVSYAAGTPGGLFAPMLVLGAQSGLMFGFAARMIFPDLPPEAFAIVGMTAFFTGVVRAPLTGIVLVTELTADATLLPPMLAGAFGAMLVPALLGNPPLYTSLRHRAERVPEASS